MRADSVGAPVTKKQWDYIHETGIALRGSLDNVTAVFAPSCIGHAVLTKRDWLNIKIDEISLPEALRCWEKSTGRGNKGLSRRASDVGGNKMSEKRRQQRERRRKNRERRRRQQQRQQERRERQLWRREKQRQREQQRQRNGSGNKLRHQRNGTTATLLTSATTIPRSGRSPISKSSNDELGNQLDNNSSSMNGNHVNKTRKHNISRHNQQSHSDHPRRTNHKRQRQHDRNQHQQQIVVSEPSRCALRLLERCSWPQCNHSCPSITNPLTGKEMRFLELLASFGLDIEAVATALGVDMTTLSNMDRTELLNLLTQTT